MRWLQTALRALFDWADRLASAAFARENPLALLGALGWFFFWIVTVSGIYLYIFFDSGVTQAYASVEELTHAQWYAGGIMRSLHRYASDAMVVVLLLHVAREFAHDRLNGARWFTWFTGVPLVWLLFAAGVSGYWVVWDRFAQYVALATTEWLDTLPFFGESIARNFLHQDALSGRFFSLLVFIHIAVPLFLLFGMWIHIQRLNQPAVNPPRRLALSLLAALVVLSLVAPAESQGPANLDEVVTRVGLDWFYFGVYPLQDIYPGAGLWAALALATLVLLVMPWLVPARRRHIAQVHLEGCNGCARCAADCPYSAITMAPRMDGASFDREARVDAARCTGCGICVGACPTATPLARRSAVRPGIELESLAVAQLRDQTLAATAALTGDARILIYACRECGPLRRPQDPALAVIELPCVGALPPSFIDLVLSRRHADGVIVAGCAENDCRERLGVAWTQARLARIRDPWLRLRVDSVRLASLWAGAVTTRHLPAVVTRLRDALASEQPARHGRLDN